MMLNTKFRFLSVLALAAAALFTASCNDATTITEEPPIQAQFDHVVPGRDGKSYTLVSGQLTATVREASGWIDRKGGWIFLQGEPVNGVPQMWGLYVSEHAVRKRTLFTIKMIGNHHAQVRLTAFQPTRNDEWINIGKRGFKQPVYLLMTYAYATNVVDPSKLTILYDPADGTAHEPVWSFHYLLENNDFIVAHLTHFSKYAMAMQ